MQQFVDFFAKQTFLWLFHWSVTGILPIKEITVVCCMTVVILILAT